MNPLQKGERRVGVLEERGRLAPQVKSRCVRLRGGSASAEDQKRGGQKATD
ncbi:MAG: hypothetical protein O7H41_13730 [Planctomycetota bacterium]|nr:hypothetical protein [Planctomycetota bacterium]